MEFLLDDPALEAEFGPHDFTPDAFPQKGGATYASKPSGSKGHNNTAKILFGVGVGALVIGLGLIAWGRQ
jgi:hypothetical protein